MAETRSPCFNFWKYHCSGIFHLFTLAAIIPIGAIPPRQLTIVLCVFLLMLIWFIADVLPVGITAFIPIVLVPLMGLMPSEQICMSYCQSSQIVLFASILMAILLDSSKTSDRLAFLWIKGFTHKPKLLLMSLMLHTWFLSTLVPSEVVCSFMIPLAKKIVQTLEQISIGKLNNEQTVFEEDVLPFPTKLTKGFALGVAFASTIGGMATLTGSYVGATMYMEYKNNLPKSKGSMSFEKFLFMGLPQSILLLIFTIVYLEVIYMGLLRPNSSDNLVFDNTASRDALNTALAQLPPYKAYNYFCLFFCVLFFVLCVFLRPIYIDGLADALNEKIVEHSAVCMVVCFAVFVLPSTYDFFKYFICREPAEYKMTPSLLSWTPVQKNMLWNYFLAYGGTIALAEAMIRGHWPIFISEHLFSNDEAGDRLEYLLVAAFLSIISADHTLAKGLFAGATRQYLMANLHPGNVFHAIAFGTQLSFLLPVSSAANCFASGWFNIRARHVILAGIGPFIVGLLLNVVTLTTLVPAFYPEFLREAY